MATRGVILVSAQITPSLIEIRANHDSSKGRMRAATLAMRLTPIALNVKWQRVGCDPIIVKK